MCCIRVAVQKQLRQRIDEAIYSPEGMDTDNALVLRNKETKKQRKFHCTSVGIDPVSSLYVSACVTM